MPARSKVDFEQVCSAADELGPNLHNKGVEYENDVDYLSQMFR